MEITYKRELKHNYLIITPEETFYDSYEIRMMASNCIEGLLKFHLKQVDDRKSYYYEITSKQPLTRILEVKSLGAEELGSLITGIVRTLERMETYLLQEGQILLEPDFIYVEPENFTVYLCLVPGRQGIFPEEMTALLQYLLGKVNHQDKECVVMAYGLYQESLKDNYGMENLLRLTGRNRMKSEQPRQFEADKAAVSHLPEKSQDGNRKSELPLPRAEIKKERRRENEGEDDWDMAQKVSSGRKVMLHGILTVCAVFAAGPAVCWFLYGAAGIREYWPVLAAVDAGAVIYGIIRMMAAKIPNANLGESSYRERDGKEGYRETENTHQWQMIFQEEDEEETAVNEIKMKPVPDAEIEECSTVLLTETEQPSNYKCLRSKEAAIDDIVIAYVPFIIGKQEGLADCVLPCDAVSRLHARIDCEGEAYRITDLNSTNGTMVGGRLLEMNETVVLLPGDEVYIANIGFIFT